MKKLSLLLVVLLAAGSAGLYGQMAIGTNFSVSGDAKTTAGYDIDDSHFGFKNDASMNIKIELVAEQSTSNAMMEDDMMEPGWVGSIELKDFKIIIDSDDEDSDLRYKAGECQKDLDDPPNGVDKDQQKINECETDKTSRSGLFIDAPDVTAKLKNGPLFLQIHSAPDNKADLVSHIEEDKKTEDDPNGERDAESHDKDDDVGLDLNGAGIALGYDSGDLKVALGITSDLAWDSGNKPNQGSFVVSADMGVALGPAGLKLQVVQGIAGENDLDEKDDKCACDDTGFAAELSTSFGEGRAITLTGGADVRMTGDPDVDTTDDNESMDFEFGAGADVTLVAMGDNKTTLGADYIYSTEKDVASDVKVKLEDSGGLVDRLGMGLTWGLFDINGGNTEDDLTAAGRDPAKFKDRDSAMDMFLEGKLSYKIDAMGGTLTPQATVTLDQVNDDKADVGLKIAAVLTDAVPATEFGLQWESTQLTDGEGDKKAAKQGEVTAWAKITYS